MRGLFRSRILVVILSGVCLWLGFLAFSATLRQYAARQELGSVEEQIRITSQGNERLASEVERLNRPAWLSLMARSKLNYKLPGETVVFVYKSEKPGMINELQTSRDERSNWKKWWDWLFGVEAGLVQW
jgi:cell division protein FtsL